MNLQPATPMRLSTAPSSLELTLRADQHAIVVNVASQPKLLDTKSTLINP